MAKSNIIVAKKRLDILFSRIKDLAGQFRKEDYDALQDMAKKSPVYGADLHSKLQMIDKINKWI